MLTRRDCLTYTATSCAISSLLPRLAAAQASDVLTRAIPKSGEKLPIVGLGSSATFSQVASAGEMEPLREVFQTMLDAGGTVFDTAPSYGRGSSEEVAGQIAGELGATEKIFWATKVNVAGGGGFGGGRAGGGGGRFGGGGRGDAGGGGARAGGVRAGGGGRGAGGGGGADPAAARAQIDTSFSYLGADPIDLIQVHNLGDMPTQFGILRELKQAGRIRYIGATTTSPGQYGQLVEWMQNEPLDFIGIDYAVDNLAAADEVFPAALDQGIAVLVYVPFGRSRLFDRVGDREVPEFAREMGAESWAQFFIKFAAGHPAVTTVTPATSKAHHMLDNMGAALGRLPDAAEQQRMIDFIESLPQA